MWKITLILKVKKKVIRKIDVSIEQRKLNCKFNRRKWLTAAKSTVKSSSKCDVRRTRFWWEREKELSRVVFRKRYSESMQQGFRRTPMLKCHCNKEHLFPKTPLDGYFLKGTVLNFQEIDVPQEYYNILLKGLYYKVLKERFLLLDIKWNQE